MGLRLREKPRDCSGLSRYLFERMRKPILCSTPAPHFHLLIGSLRGLPLNSSKSSPKNRRGQTWSGASDPCLRLDIRVLLSPSHTPSSSSTSLVTTLVTHLCHFLTGWSKRFRGPTSNVRPHKRHSLPLLK